MTQIDKIKIGGHTYSIRYSDTIARDHDACGMSSMANCDIILQTGGERTHRQEIFVHEIMEQINDIYELGLPHDKITVLSAGLFQVLIDNPGLLEGIV